MIRFVHWLRIRSSSREIIWTRFSRDQKLKKKKITKISKVQAEFKLCRINIIIGRNENAGVNMTIFCKSRDSMCDHVIWGVTRDLILNSWTFMKYKHLVFLFEKDVNPSYEHLYKFQRDENPVYETLSRS